MKANESLQKLKQGNKKPAAYLDHTSHLTAADKVLLVQPVLI